MGDFRYIPYLISQYLWISVVAFFLCVPFLIPHYNKTGEIRSRSSTNLHFNNSQVPTVFVHLSDVHVNHVVTENNDALRLAVNLINKIDPEMVIITGDLADNFPAYGIPKYGAQQPEDFDLYKSIIGEIKAKKIMQTDGNHDLFGVFDFDSKKKINESEKINDYQISTFTLNLTATGGLRSYTFVALNPFNFPSPHPPLLYYAQPSREFLDDLENVIDSIDDRNEIVLFDHFPYLQWKFGSKSTKGNTFQDIITKNGKVGYFLNGHLHPKDPVYLHHENGLLEITGTDLKEHKKFGISIIDNDRFSYHSVDITNEEPILSFVTNPLPNEILSAHQIFNDLNTYLRVIVYNKTKEEGEEEEEGPQIDVKGDVEGHLNCSKFEKFWLCEYLMKLTSKGVYHINLTGDVAKRMDFTVDDKVDSFSENVFEARSGFLEQYYVQLSVVWFLLLLIVVPYPISDFFKNRYESWIEGQSDESMWLFSIFCGFLAVKMRINRLPLFIRTSLLVGVLWPFALPTVFITIGGHFGFVWTWGFVCNGNQFDFWGLVLSLMFLADVMLPVTLLSAALALSLPIRWTLIIDILPPILAICFNFYICLRWVYETSGALGTVFSPCFSIAPLYFYILLACWRIYWKRGLKEKSLIPSTALLD